MKEIWKDVVGYEGFYQVSNLGRVKSVERAITEKSGKVRTMKQIIRKQQSCKNGYFYLTMTKNKNMKLKTVHRMVSEAFLIPILNKIFVNHKDGVKHNNCIWNLEWCSKSENELHAYRVLGKINIQKGSSNLNKRIKIKQFDLDGNFIKEHDSIKIAALETKTNRQKISSVASGKRTKTNGFIWKY